MAMIRFFAFSVKFVCREYQSPTLPPAKYPVGFIERRCVVVIEEQDAANKFLLTFDITRMCILN